MPQWEYIKIQGPSAIGTELMENLAHAGLAGFEMCGFADQGKAFGLDTVVAVLKRPGRAREEPKKPRKEDWHADPYGRHEYRMWCPKSYWTQYVRNQGKHSEDHPWFGE